MGNLPSEKPTSKPIETGKVLFIIGMIFVAFNLRPAITAVGPLISSIRLDIEISNTAAGLLTTLPLIAFAILSPLAPRIGRSIGNETTILIALIILTLGIFLRSTGFVFTLYVGTALLGLAIAIINVLLPSIVKHKFPLKIGLMTGMYTTSMGIMASLASGVSVPLAHGLNLGWQKSLVVWSIIAGVALLLWLPQLRNINYAAQLPTVTQAKSSIWRSTIAWQVTLFMGFQSFIFYCMIAWLPAILISRGVDVSTAGWMLALMQFAGLPSTFLIPILADRLRNQRVIVIGIGFFYIISFIGLLSGGNIIFVTIFIILLGLAQGAGISLALTLFGLRTENGSQAASLSGMAQSIGYLLAAIGPLFVGLLFDTFFSWTYPLITLIIVTIALVSFGVGAGRNKYIFQKK